MQYNYFVKYSIVRNTGDWYEARKCAYQEREFCSTVVTLNYQLNEETFPIFSDAFCDSKSFANSYIRIEDISFLGSED